MPSFSAEDVGHMLQVARDASLGSGFAERFAAIGESLLALIPGIDLSVMVIPGDGGLLERHGLLQRGEDQKVHDYLAHYRALDPMAGGIAACTGLAHALSDALGPGGFGRDPYTADFLAPQGIREIVGIVHRLPGEGRFVLGIHRDARQGEFTARERGVLRLIGPDLRRAALESTSPPRVDPAVAFMAVSSRADLSPREREVAARAIEGHGNQRIAIDLGIASSTVNVHLGSIYRKCGVSGRVELARLLTGLDPPR